MNAVSFDKYTKSTKKGLLRMGHNKIMSIFGIIK